jgi:hypothetical protein
MNIETGETRGWWQFMVRFVPGLDDLEPTDDTDNEIDPSDDTEIPDECIDYSIDRVFYPANQ